MVVVIAEFVQLILVANFRLEDMKHQGFYEQRGDFLITFPDALYE